MLSCICCSKRRFSSSVLQRWSDKMRVSSAGETLGVALANGNGEPALFGLAVLLVDCGLLSSSWPCGRLRAVGLRSTYSVRDAVVGRRPRGESRHGNVGAFDGVRDVCVVAAVAACRAAVVDVGRTVKST